MSRLIIGPGKGHERKEGDVFLDMNPLWAEVVCDIEESPLPFDDNEFDSIEILNVLEHIDKKGNYQRVINEIYRVLKPEGTVWIKVPYYLHIDAVATHDHCRFFCDHSFNDFTIHNPTREEQGIKVKFDYVLKHTLPDSNGNPCQVEVILKKLI